MFTDRKLGRFLPGKKKLFRIFGVMTLIIVVMYIQILPVNLGIAKAELDGNGEGILSSFPEVQLEVIEPIGGAEIAWKETTAGHYINVNPIILLHSSNDYLVVRPAISKANTYIVNKEYIITFEVIQQD
ncbi:hypothetical protein ES703_117425 [subsurface metagenome]